MAPISHLDSDSLALAARVDKVRHVRRSGHALSEPILIQKAESNKVIRWRPYIPCRLRLTKSSRTNPSHFQSF